MFIYNRYYLIRYLVANCNIIDTLLIVNFKGFCMTAPVNSSPTIKNVINELGYGRNNLRKVEVVSAFQSNRPLDLEKAKDMRRFSEIESLNFFKNIPIKDLELLKKIDGRILRIEIQHRIIDEMRANPNNPLSAKLIKKANQSIKGYFKDLAELFKKV